MCAPGRDWDYLRLLRLVLNRAARGQYAAGEYATFIVVAGAFFVGAGAIGQIIPVKCVRQARYALHLQRCPFFKETRTPQAWLLSRTQKKNPIEASVAKRPEACYQIISNEPDLDK